MLGMSGDSGAGTLTCTPLPFGWARKFQCKAGLLLDQAAEIIGVGDAYIALTGSDGFSILVSSGKGSVRGWHPGLDDLFGPGFAVFAIIIAPATDCRLSWRCAGTGGLSILELPRSS